MLIHFSFSVVILIIAIITGILCAVVLLIEKTNTAANKYLAALVLVSAGSLFHNFLIESGIYNAHPDLYFLPVILSLGIGPLLYLYVSRLIGFTKMPGTKIILHLLPAIIQFMLYAYCFVQNADTKYNIYSQVYEPIAKPIQNIAVYISMAAYLYLSFAEIMRYRVRLNNFYSDAHLVGLSWLRRLLFIFMFYYILLILFSLAANAFHFSDNYFPGDIIRCVIIFTIAFFAVKQNSLVEMQADIRSVEPENALPENINASEETESIAPVIAEAELSISDELSKPINHELLDKLISITENEKLYLNETLTIADLAAKAGCSTRTVSQTINAGLDKSFSRFINEYRVNLFKERKASGKFEHMSIMGLAYDCGFNSKSAFNRIYKDITGSVPKEQKNDE